MKIAISTNDGRIISPAFETANGFLVLTLAHGEIIKEEIRINQISGIDPAEKIFSLLSDCSTFIVRGISDRSMDFFRIKELTVIRTDEEIITNQIVQYLEYAYREASNTCCCP